MSLQDNCSVQEVKTSHRGDCFLLLPSGERVLVKYMNGLQILGFSFAFFGLASAFLGLLDSVLIPSLSPTDSNNYPVEFSLANGYGLPIYTGMLVLSTGAMALRTIISLRYTSLRRFYTSLWLVLLLNVVYWCCLIAAISYGNFSSDTSSNKISNSHIVTRVFTAVNSGLSLIPCFTGLILYSHPVLSRYQNILCFYSLIQRFSYSSSYRRLFEGQNRNDSTSSISE
ncbi:unnamed protein product [Schistosoma rodhaini]|uniref:Uncharacterized protein n=1 Tax=Schistosoma mansoni TaxID=6183 RepID=A0A3Q0KRF6_SCHMA|nr:unnamed protein product [Schistosoma rodhaini]